MRHELNEQLAFVGGHLGYAVLPEHRRALRRGPHARGARIAREVGLDRVLVTWGYVRNLVLRPAADYPWPTPVACFSVWRATAGAPIVPGAWVPRAELGERHWWPLAEHEADQRRRVCGDQPSVPDR